MLRGSVTSGACSRYGDRECFGGTGSGAFAAEHFSFSSSSDAYDYVDSMTGGNSRNGQYGSSMSSNGRYGVGNRARAWTHVASSVMAAVKTAVCGSGHRRQMTGTEAADAIEAHLNGSSPLNLDIAELEAAFMMDGGLCYMYQPLRHDASPPDRLPIRVHVHVLGLHGRCNGR